jgi:hypothetical protein
MMSIHFSLSAAARQHVCGPRIIGKCRPPGKVSSGIFDRQTGLAARGATPHNPAHFVGKTNRHGFGAQG